MRKLPTLAWLVAFALVLTACSSDAIGEAVAEKIIEEAVGGDVDIDIDTDSGEISLSDDDDSVTVEGDDGSVVIGGDDDEMTMDISGEDGDMSISMGGELPEDFPFPLPDEFEVASSMQFEDENGIMYTGVITIEPEEYEAVRAMYEAWLEDEGFELEVFEMSNEDTFDTVFIDGSREDVGVSITLSTDDVANDDDGNLIYKTSVSLSWLPKG